MLFVSASGLLVRAAAARVCGSGISGLTSPEAARLPGSLLARRLPPSRVMRVKKIDHKDKGKNRERRKRKAKM